MKYTVFLSDFKEPWIFLEKYSNIKFHENPSSGSGLGSVVGIATGYGLDGPGIESRWGGRFSAPVQTGPGAHPAPCTMGIGSFPGVKSGRGVTLTPQPLLVPWSWKGRAIPLLPLWAVRPVQSLSACTRVHFTFILRPVGGELFHADRRSEMTKLTAAFRTLANAPKNNLIIRVYSRSSYNAHQKNEPQEVYERVKMCLCAHWTSINRDVCWGIMSTVISVILGN